MSHILELQQLKQYGEDILQALPPEPPKHLAGLHQNVAEAAKRLVQKASSPVKIGVVGEFSSGKTLLLGSLVGCGDVLPVSANPSTGNITALRFVQDDAAKDTRPNKFEVEYLDQTGVEDCLGYLLSQLSGRARAAGLAPILVDELAGMKPREQSVWLKLQEWCRRAWQGSPNPGLRLLVRETILFVRAYLACGGGLAGNTFVIDGPSAREGLLLSVSEEDLQKLSFDRLAAPPESIPRKPDRLTSVQLRASFPLIRRVEAEIRLPRHIWDLSDLRGSNEFVLLDFPGLGAAGSSARDTYLCLRELEEVQTILILINSYHPGGREALDIFDMMQQRRGSAVKDCVLVGITRFDQLPLLSDGGREALEKLAGSGLANGFGETLAGLMESEPITEESACEQIRVLKEVVTRARDLTDQPDRVMILSAVRGLAHLQATVPADQVFGSAQFLRELDSYKVDADQHVPLWKRLSQSLASVGARDALATWLGDYCVDGGRTRLLNLLHRHVATHGLRQLKAMVDRVADEAEGAMRSLVAAATPAQQTTGPLSADAGRLDQLITEVASTYKSFAEDLKKSRPDLRLWPEGLLAVHQLVCNRFDINVPPVDIRNGVPPSVHDVIRDEVAQILFSWDQWHQMRLQIREGCIPAIEKKEGNSLGDLIDLPPEVFQSAPLPQRTEDFLDPFQKALVRCEWFGRLCVQQAIPGIFASLDRQLAKLREDLRPLWTTPGRLEQVTHQGGKDAQVALIVLREAVELKGLMASFIKQFSTEHGETHLLKVAEQGASPLAQAARLVFPLAQPSPRHPLGRLLPWAASPTAPRSGNHQILMIRMRDALTTSATQATSQLVSQLSQHVINRMIKVSGDIYNQILQARGKPSVRRALTTPFQPTEQPAPSGSPYATLARLRRPSN